MRRPAALFICAFALVAVPPAWAAPRVGVAEDAPKWARDGGASVYARMQAIGMSEIRLTVTWDPARPTTILDKAQLDGAVANAGPYGVRVVFSIGFVNAWALAADTKRRTALFARFLQKLARAYPQVTEYIVGNEPNERRFWQPQFGPGRRQLSGAAYERVLAAGYDALKAVNPAIVVVGGGISNEANDVTSTSPLRFIRAMGDAYRASGRAAPIMDQLGLHLYPVRNTDPPTRHYDWPNVSVADLDRVKQAIWDAFDGTGQPTFAERGQRSGGRVLTFKIDELGWQTVPGPAAKAYHGVENVTPVSEEEQARIYARVIRSLACDPSVGELLLFHLVDEADLDRFQSGLVRADGSLRPAYAAVKQAIAQAGSCGALHAWRHTTGVISARATFDGRAQPAQRHAFRLTATAGEDVFARAGVFRVERGTGRLSADAASRALASGGSERAPLLAASRLLRAGWTPRVELRGRLRPGYYVVAVRLTAALNANRAETLVSGVFRVGRPGGKTPRR